MCVYIYIYIYICTYMFIPTYSNYTVHTCIIYTSKMYMDI